jgi:cytosine/adenosine deaminase-related metal-dependent hydrolase
VKTLIEGGWVVAYNGASHEIHERGSVVVEDDHILHAGGPYTGAADVRLSARGKLVSPGFIKTHVQTADSGGDYLLLEWPTTTTAPRTT